MKSGFSRREAIGMAVGCVGSLVLPKPDCSAEDLNSPKGTEESLAKLYALRDPEKAYSAFKDLNQKSPLYPPYSIFREALSVCREAACTVYLVRNGSIASTTSGFLIDLPEDRLTSRAANKRYVVTCDHMRVGNTDGSAQLSFPDGTIVRPERQLIESTQTNGFPVKDLRVYECSGEALRGKRGIPCYELADEIPKGFFMLTYEPPNLRVPTTMSTNASKSLVTVQRFDDQKIPIEQFVVSKVTNSRAWGEQQDPNYPQNSGFLLDGYLRPGASGAPAVLITSKGFAAGGLQVSFVPEPVRADDFTMEVKNDARIVHINNVVELLKKQSIIR